MATCESRMVASFREDDESILRKGLSVDEQQATLCRRL